MEINYDFDGSLRLTEVVEDFFYSPSTGLYVFRHPVIVDERVLKAADDLEIRVEASPEKWMVNTRLADSLRILNRLGSGPMSLPEYFMVRRDAINLRDKNMLSSLESDQFIEMLSTVFLNDEYMIHHPEVKGALSFSGKKIAVQTPVGHYGWIHPDKIDPNTGLPIEVSSVRDIDDETIKYWDTHSEIGKKGILMAIRGYVTSIGKISLDLGLPADAISKKLTIRECKRALPKGLLETKVLDEAKSVLAKYYDSLDKKTICKSVPEWHPQLLSFVTRYKTSLLSSNDTASSVLKEDIRDCLGLILSYSVLNNRTVVADEVRNICQNLSGLQAIRDEDFKSFVESTKEKMADSFKHHGSTVFVIGHRNPDTDTVVSSVAEAYRQELINPGKSSFVPVVDGSTIPKEVVELLGDELSRFLILTDSNDYLTASRSGRPEWIMVDHNIGPQQSDTRQIIDHHYPSSVSLRQQIPRRIVFAGSTTALVSQRLYGLGIEIPQNMARILHGAALMDTENRFVGKMTALDELIMNRLQLASGISDERSCYQHLMKRLLSCYNPDELFARDYKEDWGFFGFSVAKGIRLLDLQHSKLVEKLQLLAQENNKSKNLPLTLVKVVDYAEDADTIRKERIYTVFNQSALPDFKDAVKDTIVTVIKHESPRNVQIKILEDLVEYYGVGTQLSRKKLAPVLDLVVTAFNQYFYSPSTGLYFKRDFLRKNKKVEAIAKKHGLKLHTDKEGVVVGNPAELKFYFQNLGLLCATPSEYFHAYFDALNVKDERMVAHLTSSRYLETLDAIVENKELLIERPEIILTPAGFSYKGGYRLSAKIPEGKPGLIDPKKVDLSTGMPTEVEDPRQYGKELWRYWGPDSNCAWVLRSTIFAYDIPSLDLKFEFAEELPRLSIRPCLRSMKSPKVTVYEADKRIVVDIEDD